jgi:hypothetical protein
MQLLRPHATAHYLSSTISVQAVADVDIVQLTLSAFTVISCFLAVTTDSCCTLLIAF